MPIEPAPGPIIINHMGLDAADPDVMVDESLDEATGVRTLSYRQMTPEQIQERRDVQTIDEFLAADHSGNQVAEVLAAFMRHLMA